MNEKLTILINYTKTIPIGDEPTWERLIAACYRLHKEHLFMGYKNRDLIFTFQHLLGGGEKFGNSKHFLPKLEFNKENLFDRVVMAIQFYNEFEEKRTAIINNSKNFFNNL